jgi:hypothetical protein
MKSLDALRTQWNEENGGSENQYDHDSFMKVVKTRVRKESGRAFQYFWAAFVLQIVVYALLGHVIVKYWRDSYIFIPAIINLALYIPFTVVMMKRFKRMATISGKTSADNAVADYVSRHRDILAGFYKFKQSYEYLLIPVSAIIGTVITFQIWVEGGVWEFPKAAAIVFGVTMVSCIIAVRNENKKNFEGPLAQMNAIVEELKDKN